MSRHHKSPSLTGRLSAFCLPALLVLTLGCTSTQPGQTSEPQATASPTATAQAATPQASDLTGGNVLESVGFGSCLHQDDPQPILNVVVERDFDLFLMLGDNVYGDVTSTVEMTELYQAYAQQAASESFQALWSSTPILAVWDDHDFGLNDAGSTFAGREPAERLFEQFWQIPEDAASRQWPGIYDAHLFGPPGRRVQILLLDTRYFRSDLKDSLDENRRYDPDPDPQKTMLGAEQWRWLEEQLQKPADLRLLVSSIQILAEGHGWEAWRTLPLERDRLYDALKRSGARGVIALSGDRHRAGIYRRDDVIGYPFYEITSSSLNRPSGSPEEPGPHRLGPTYRPENFGAVHIDWTAGTVQLEIADIEGQTVLSETLSIGDLRPPP